MEIKNIVGRMIIDSRGNPTVEADITLANGSFGRAAVPSGASTGSHEAHELRDGGKAFGGLHVSQAVQNINEIIAPRLLGLNADNQKTIDELMCNIDSTPNKEHLGANAILAVSLAVAHAAAKGRGQLLYSYIHDIHDHVKRFPVPMMNILNGGKHAIGGSDVQETMIIPHGASSMRHAIQIGSEIFHTLATLLRARGEMTLVGDEGGYAPRFTSYIEALDLVMQAISDSGYHPGQDVSIGLDVATSEIFSNGVYTFKQEERTFTTDEIIDWYDGLTKKYPIISIEDGLSEDEWDGWTALNSRLGQRTMLVGDDFFVTNPERLRKGIENNCANAILIKPNQIGTLSETLETISIAQSAGYKVVISHRSGETEDTTISHIAVGTGAEYIKTGSLSRSERLAKYNELMRLEDIDANLAYPSSR